MARRRIRSYAEALSFFYSSAAAKFDLERKGQGRFPSDPFSSQARGL
jgi:hypothetical protein